MSKKEESLLKTVEQYCFRSGWKLTNSESDLHYWSSDGRRSGAKYWLEVEIPSPNWRHKERKYDLIIVLTHTSELYSGLEPEWSPIYVWLGTRVSTTEWKGLEKWFEKILSMWPDCNGRLYSHKWDFRLTPAETLTDPYELENNAKYLARCADQFWLLVNRVKETADEVVGIKEEKI